MGREQGQRDRPGAPWPLLLVVDHALSRRAEEGRAAFLAPLDALPPALQRDPAKRPARVLQVLPLLAAALPPGESPTWPPCATLPAEAHWTLG